MRRRQRSQTEPKKPKKKPPQSMADVMSRLMAQRGYSRLLSHDDFSDAWQEVAGALAEHSRAGRVRRGVLEVVVSSSIVMQELGFQKTQLIKKLAARLPDHKIRDVRFKVGPFGN